MSTDSAELLARLRRIEDHLATLARASVSVRRDSEGRYSLNDLHRAAGAEVKHRPSTWLQNQQTRALVDEVARDGASRNSVTPVTTVNDGANNGTYVAKELVYAFELTEI